MGLDIYLPAEGEELYFYLFIFFASHFLQPVTVIWCLTVIIIKDTGFSTLLFVALSHVLQHL